MWVYVYRYIVNGASANADKFSLRPATLKMKAAEHPFS